MYFKVQALFVWKVEIQDSINLSRYQNWLQPNMGISCQHNPTSFEERHSWQWFAVFMCALSIGGGAINSCAMFLLIRFRAKLRRNPSRFMITLFLGQLIAALIVGPYRIQSSITLTKSTPCNFSSATSFVNSLLLISAVAKGLYFHLPFFSRTM